LNVNKDNVIEEISFVGDGCAISRASASMMTAAIKGKPSLRPIHFLMNFTS